MRRRSLRLVWTEVRAGRYVRIFHSRKAASDAEAKGAIVVGYQPLKRAVVVRDIRQQVFVRAKGDCERCGAPLTWDSMHMHERVHRGQGGEISLDNSEALCAACHIGSAGVHSDRLPTFHKTDNKVCST